MLVDGINTCSTQKLATRQPSTGDLVVATDVANDSCDVDV